MPKVSPVRRPHGHISTYTNDGCRCAPCRATAAAYKAKSLQQRLAMGDRRNQQGWVGDGYFRSRPDNYAADEALYLKLTAAKSARRQVKKEKK